MSELKSKVIKGLFWKFGERMGAEVVSFIVSIVLARLMMPEDFGTIALVTVFITLANVFVAAGFGNALIQKKEIDNYDFSTIFFFNLVFSISFYILLFVTAPYIAAFYSNPILKPVLRVLGLRVIVASINNVQQAYVSRNMMFKKFFFSTIIGTSCGATTGIILAYAGYGVWALVAQNLLAACLDTIVLWITVKWRPVLYFSITRLRNMFSYGWKLFLSALLDTGYNEVRSLLIGKMYSPSQLAYYNRGNSFPSLIITNISSSISGVLFPAVSSEQDNLSKVKSMTRRSIKLSTFFITPMMVGLAVVADPLVRILLTEKWLPSVVFLQLGCLAFVFRPISTANLEAIKAIGRSDIFLKLEVIKKSIGFLLLFVASQFGVYAIAWSAVITTIISMIINTYPNRKLLGYTYKEQVVDLIPTFFISLCMGILVYPITYINIPSIIMILCQSVSGVIIFFVLAYFTKNENLKYLLESFQNRKK